MRLPSLPARDPGEPHRASTPLELLFDLISVIAISAVTAALHHAITEGHGTDQLPRFMLIFFAIWWCWMNFTWFASAFDDNGPLYQVTVMVIMAGELLFAGGVGSITTGLDFSWGIVGWCVMRLGMAVLWYRASLNGQYRMTARRYMGGIIAAQVCWVVLYLAVPPASASFLPLAALIFAVEIAVPTWAESAARTPYHRTHIIERYGLLAIISLGEIMLSISLGLGALYGERPEWRTALTALSGLIIAFSVFWVYFADEEHMPARGLRREIVWGYLHVLIFAGIAVLGAGIAARIDLSQGHGGASRASVAGWLGGAMAVILGTLWLIRDCHHPLGARGPALLVMAADALLAGWAGLPTPAFAVIGLLTALWRNPQSRRLC